MLALDQLSYCQVQYKAHATVGYQGAGLISEQWTYSIPIRGIAHTDTMLVTILESKLDALAHP